MIHFINLSENEKEIANQFLKISLNYFDCVGQLKSYNQFLKLFNNLCKNRNYNPNQLKLFNEIYLDNLNNRKP